MNQKYATTYFNGLLLFASLQGWYTALLVLACFQLSILSFTQFAGLGVLGNGYISCGKSESGIYFA